MEERSPDLRPLHWFALDLSHFAAPSSRIIKLGNDLGFGARTDRSDRPRHRPWGRIPQPEADREDRFLRRVAGKVIAQTPLSIRMAPLCRKMNASIRTRCHFAPNLPSWQGDKKIRQMTPHASRSQALLPTLSGIALDPNPVPRTVAGMFLHPDSRPGVAPTECRSPASPGQATGGRSRCPSFARASRSPGHSARTSRQSRADSARSPRSAASAARLRRVR